MHQARDILRSGAWVTRERMWVVGAALLVASAIGMLYLVITANGAIDVRGRPLGTDFSDVYAAGTYVLAGDPAAPFDLARQHAREQKIFGQATPFYGWHYPPFFLFIAGALALMPYGVALVVWQAATLALYLAVIRAILMRAALPRGDPSDETQHHAPAGKPSRPAGPPPAGPAPPRRGDDWLWLVLALAFPAVLVNVGHGQNGFLSAALLGGALMAMDRRPLVAGALFGLMAYKPQFGLMIPIALAASGRWRCFAAAAATVAALTLATTLAFGPQVWQAFLESARFTRTVVLEQGNTGWYKIQSVFAWARMWGGPISIAYALQASMAVLLGAAIARLWRGAAAYPLKAAALCLAAVLATPYTFDYDMMVLGPAIAFLVAEGRARGFHAWEKTALAALFLTPLVARGIAHATLVPLGVPVMLLVFVLVLRRSTKDSGLPMAFRQAPSTMADRPWSTSRGHDIAAFEEYVAPIAAHGASRNGHVHALFDAAFRQ